MIISDRFRFVFVHIPKCGGTSVRRALAEFDERNHVYFSRGRNKHEQLDFLDYHHIPLALLRDYFTEDFECVKNYISFALARDPFARFPSSLSERIIWRGGTPQELTSREVAREADEAIEYLSTPSLRLPIIEPDYIHFGRQVDYVNIDGNNIVKHIYPIEQLPDMLCQIENLIGKKLKTIQQENERLSYNSKILQYFDNSAQKLIMNIVPKRVWRPAFRLIKRALIEVGILNKWSHWHENIFNSPRVSRFVAEFYADDIQLYNQSQSWVKQIDGGFTRI